MGESEPGPSLIGDGIENPANARLMTRAAAMFGWSCAFRDRFELAAHWEGQAPRWVEIGELSHEPLVAFDNARQAECLYGRNPGSLATLGLVLGNERKGIAGDMLGKASQIVQVPMASKRVNCLNVAAAAAVALYYFSRGGGGKLYSRADPRRHRPEILLLGGGDHFELGSAVRSAAAFGWERAFIEDRAGVWFGVDRIQRSQGRAAARRGKNSIKLIAANAERRYAFEEALIVSQRPGRNPLSRANLARGPGQLIVLADEQQVDLDAEPLDRLARKTRRLSIERPKGAVDAVFPYRLGASIALAEVARQVGIRDRKERRRRGPPMYERALETLIDGGGETVSLEELMGY